VSRERQATPKIIVTALLPDVLLDGLSVAAMGEDTEVYAIS
jgi:hypothetical protein